MKRSVYCAGWALAVAVMIGGGCSAGSPQTTPPRSEVVDWEDWRPREPVRDLKKLSESDKMAMRESILNDLAQSYGFEDAPVVELDRWIRPEEMGSTAEKCFDDAGFEVESTPDGTGFRVISNVGESQRDALNMTAYQCRARHFIDPDAMQPLTRDQSRVVYEYYIAVLVPCLQGLGHETGKPPSLDTFVSTDLASQWSPIRDLGLGDAALDVALDRCHQAPPLPALYGE